MKILVLGSEGQIGKPFCSLAKSRNHDIINFDKKLGSGFDLAFDDCDILLNESIKNCDVVLFLAFEVGGSKFLEKKDNTLDYISENVRLMDRTFNRLSYYKKPFLFASSQMSNMFHTNYGFLKNLGERYVKSLDFGHICRFWNVYGYEDPNDPKSHVITDFIHMAKTNKIIHMRTDGTEDRQFLHADDCSKSLLYWCENHHLYDRNRYLDITSFKWTSIFDIAKTIQKIIPCDILLGDKKDSIQNGIKNEPDEYVLKFWKPELSLEEGINKLI